MNKLHIFQLLFIIFSIGCSRQSSDISITIVNDFPQNITISGAPIESMKEKHYAINGLIVIDSFLVVLDMNEKKPIFVYSTETYELRGEFSSIGRGPGEFISPTIIKHSDLFNSFLNIYDSSLGILTRVDIASSIENNEYIYTSTSCDIWNKAFTDRVFFETKDFCCVEPEGQWFSFYNEKDNKFTNVPYPKLKFSFRDENIRYRLFYPEICYNPILSKVVVSSFFIGYLSLYDTAGEHLTTIDYDFDPDYMKDLKSLNSNNRIALKNYIGDMQADSQYIYAVNYNFRGEVSESPEKNEILIFDWNGLPVKRLSLDRAIGAIALDYDKKKMFGYGTCEDDFPIIVYDMTSWEL
jgi:hypothetical protein